MSANSKPNEGGQKADTTKKHRPELLSSHFLLGVSEVLAYGAKKYADHNWRLGIKQSRLLGALLRHVLSYVDGEDNDPETGLSHLHHAGCCLMFLSEMAADRPDLDDRYKRIKKDIANLS